MAWRTKGPPSPRLHRRAGACFRVRTTAGCGNARAASPANHAAQLASSVGRKTSPQRFAIRSGDSSGVEATVSNFSLREIGVPPTSPPLLAGRLLATGILYEKKPASDDAGVALGNHRRNWSPWSETTPPDPSAGGSAQDDLPSLCEEIVSAYTTMRGPRPVRQEDPLGALRGIARHASSPAGSMSSSASAASSASAVIFSEGKQSSPYQTTVLTPVDDLGSDLSSQRTIIYNIQRSPQKQAHVRLPIIGIHAPEIRAKFDGDPWKCKPFEALDHNLLPVIEPGLPADDSKIMSPDTFLALAEGAQLWDSDNLHREAMAKMPEPVRMRPLNATPKTPEPRPRFGDRWNPAGFESQYDLESGEEMSPHYRVPSSPSILWSPRPVTPEMMYRHFPHGEFDRMDPAAAQACREASLGPIPSFGATSEQGPDHEVFTDEEIDEVLATYHGPIFDDIYASGFRDAIETMEEHLGLSRLEEMKLERQNERLRQRLRNLERLQETCGGAVGRGRPSTACSPHDVQCCCSGGGVVDPAKRARILRRMATQLRDNLWEYHCVQEAVYAARREHAMLQVQIERLERHLYEAAPMPSETTFDNDMCDGAYQSV